jgi:hypothetical protein
MTQEPKTAGLLPRPVWILVRLFGATQLRALGPICTLERLKGLFLGLTWSRPEDKIEGFADAVPEGYSEVRINERHTPFAAMETQTFEQQLVNILWFDYRENHWDEEKEWNADRWQDVGILLESFGIEFPGVDAPKPHDAEKDDKEEEAT